MIVLQRPAGRCTPDPHPGGYAVRHPGCPITPQCPKTREPKTPGNKACPATAAGAAGRMSGPALARLKRTEMAYKQRERKAHTDERIMVQRSRTPHRSHHTAMTSAPHSGQTFRVQREFTTISWALDFRGYAARSSQARQMTRNSSGVGWSGRVALNLAAMMTRRSLAAMSAVDGWVLVVYQGTRAR